MMSFRSIEYVLFVEDTCEEDDETKDEFYGFQKGTSFNHLRTLEIWQITVFPYNKQDPDLKLSLRVTYSFFSSGLCEAVAEIEEPPSERSVGKAVFEMVCLQQHLLKSLPIAQYSSLFSIAQPSGLNPLPKALRAEEKKLLLIALLAVLIWTSACRNRTELSSLLPHQ
ncbi:hypothetical protein MJT46_000654 [Ovis ammon polii x Ovis aries]|nr:hypothetical protein MJT46_000654 [Ovis ammon polii x Ovis aries]